MCYASGLFIRDTKPNLKRQCVPEGNQRTTRLHFHYTVSSNSLFGFRCRLASGPRRVCRYGRRREKALKKTTGTPSRRGTPLPPHANPYPLPNQVNQANQPIHFHPIHSPIPPLAGRETRLSKEAVEFPRAGKHAYLSFFFFSVSLPLLQGYVGWEGREG